jgi:hypothetical protein
MSFNLSIQMHRVAALQASGLNSAQVSSIVGLSPSRISQIVASDEYKTLLEMKREETEKKDVEETAITAKYLSAEHALINQVLNLAPSSELRDVTNALRVVAERQEKSALRKNPVHASQVTHQNIVQLFLPQHAVPELSISSTNEVTAIDNKTLAPLSSGGVTALFSAMKGVNNDRKGITIEAERVIAAPAPAQECAQQSLF